MMKVDYGCDALNGDSKVNGTHIFFIVVLYFLLVLYFSIFYVTYVLTVT